MKKLIAVAIIAVLVPACAMQYKKTEQEMKQPINCATAEGICGRCSRRRPMLRSR